jgi:tRNA(fMet)-specific endonuclease VapC
LTRCLLDTDICINMRRRRARQAIARFLTVPSQGVAMSVVTCGELAFGAWNRPGDLDEALGGLAELVSIIPVEPLPNEAGLIYGRLRADLSRRDELIGGNGLWIAAHALAAGLTLVTGNRREFARIDGLNVEDWTA